MTVPEKVVTFVVDVLGSSPVWTFPFSGLGGVPLALASTCDDALVVKHAVDGMPREKLAAEINLWRKVSHLSGLAHVRAADINIAAVAFDVAHTDPDAVWDGTMWAKADTILTSINTVDGTGLTQVTDWAAFRDRGEAGKVAAFALCEPKMAQTMLDCSSQLRAWPPAGQVVSHCDTHPGNWVLTADGPVLLDVAHLAFAPPGFDQVFLAAHLPIEPRLRATWLDLAGVNRDVALTVTGAVALRLAVGMFHEDRAWQHFCHTALPAAFGLLQELQQ